MTENDLVNPFKSLNLYGLDNYFNELIKVIDKLQLHEMTNELIKIRKINPLL